MSDPVSYVRELKIPSPGDAIVAAADSGDQGFVVGGSLVAFLTDVTKRQHSDVLCSTLLAQLSADYWYERQYQTSQWYNKYVEVLAIVLGGILKAVSLKSTTQVTKNDRSPLLSLMLLKMLEAEPHFLLLSLPSTCSTILQIKIGGMCSARKV